MPKASLVKIFLLDNFTGIVFKEPSLIIVTSIVFPGLLELK